MVLRYSVGDMVKLNIELTFSTPPNLPAGSLGNITKLITSTDAYFVKFAQRADDVFVFDDQLE